MLSKRNFQFAELQNFAVGLCFYCPLNPNLKLVQIAAVKLLKPRSVENGAIPFRQIHYSRKMQRTNNLIAVLISIKFSNKYIIYVPNTCILLRIAKRLPLQGLKPFSKGEKQEQAQRRSCYRSIKITRVLFRQAFASDAFHRHSGHVRYGFFPIFGKQNRPLR